MLPVFMGISGMMHGYLAFDKDWNLLAPFRTWQNTMTGEAAEQLTAEFGFNIPQRWSIAHLYQAVLNGEAHVKNIAHITTLAGYVHYLLTGENVLGVGEASGMFPIDSEALDYDAAMLEKFDALIAKYGFAWTARSVLPKVLTAGQAAGALTQAGSTFLDGLLSAGIPFCPPEGDAGTGMTATNAVAPRTGNVSAGTSIFAMVVLEKPLSKVYQEIDMVTTPSGKPVAMVHCNNCTNDMNAWVSLLGETAKLFGAEVSTGELFTKLYQKSLEGDADCSGVLTNLVFRKDDVVIMDMEAGLEHLGRGTASMMDQFIVVIEPGARSVQTYVRIKELAKDIGVTKVRVVANKIRDESDREFIRSRIPADDLLGFISYSPTVIDADRKGLSPYDGSPDALDEIRAIKAAIDAKE